MRSSRRPVSLLLLAVALGLSAGCRFDAPPESRVSYTELVQRTFASPEDAVVALIDAAREGDVDAVRTIFGPDVEGLESDSADRTQGDLQRLAAAYDRQHALFLEEGTNGTPPSVTLAVGADLWEFPVPIARVRDGAEPLWRFDTAAGVAIVHAARIETNEAAAVDFLLACMPAQSQYRDLAPLGVSAYTTRFRSERGTRNGLWWPESLTPPVSPLGPMVDDGVARATEPVDLEALSSYRGYRYRILAAPGPAAVRNGSPDASPWLNRNGDLVGGFAFLAWPLSYGDTGERAFLVSMDGSVWSRDFGLYADAAIEPVTSFDPGTGWERVEFAP